MSLRPATAALALSAMMALADVGFAQTAPQASPGSAAPAAEAADPLVARVFGEPMHLSDVLRTAADLIPAELRGAPPAQVFAMLPAESGRELTERAITERAFVIAARRAGLHRSEEVQWRVRRAEETALREALLTREIGAALSDDALRARFERDGASRAPAEEVKARHILVRTEAEASEALAEARRPGADFAEVARRRSSDPGTARSGGELGFFKKGDMVAEFAEAAFALKPGEISEVPVRTQFGWHVIKVEERRNVPPPGFEEVREALARQAMHEEAQAAIRRIREAAAIERFDQPPAAQRLMDGAVPPPAGTPARR